MDTITNLRDLCNFFSVATPDELSRSIYHNTDCGASISIHVGKIESFKDTFIITFKQHTPRKITFSTDKPLPETATKFFCLDENRFPFKSLARLQKETFRLMAEKNLNFGDKSIVIQKAVYDKEKSLVVEIECTWQKDESDWIHNGDVIKIGTQPQVKGFTCPKCKTSDWPYELSLPCDDDSQEEIFTGKYFFKCPKCHYECEITEDQYQYQAPIYKSSWDIPIDTPLIGFTIQTMVEGSEATVDSEEFEVPVSTKEVDEWVKEMESQADFYWKRDNHLHLKIESPRGRQYFAEITWRGYKFYEAKKIPKKVKLGVEKFFKEKEKLGDSVDYDTPYDVPDCKGWKVSEYIDDSTF